MDITPDDDREGEESSGWTSSGFPRFALLLVVLASMASVELGVSVALLEISFGVFAGNVLGLQSPPWMDFLASFGGIVLTFLAGAEVDSRLMREKLTPSLLIGGLSFLLPFLAAWAVCRLVLHWSAAAALKRAATAGARTVVPEWQQSEMTSTRASAGKADQRA